MKIGDWVTHKDAKFSQYGVIERHWNGKFVVSWGWRVGGTWNGIAAKEDLLVIPCPYDVVDKGVQLIKENLKKHKWRFGKDYAYDAASMELFQYILENINNENS